jgi:3-hydroxyisobutyrate dehydrogenase-like beta-hydroxyacid dehydrogenase
MSDVSVIGAGAMGSALVEVFAASGVDVVVWNRTGAEAEGLSGPRVRVARSVGEALTSSPLAIVSVSDHQVARALVGEAGVGLGGRAVASTSPVDLDQAASFDTVVTAAGGHYLDLAIPRSDGQVRTGAGVFLVSGDRAAYEANRELLDRVGTATYVADAPGTAYVGGLAVVLAYLPMAVGLLQGLRICRQHDVPPEWFERTALDFYSFQIRSLLDQVTGRIDPSAGDEGSVDAMAAWAAELAVSLRAMGLDAGMFDALRWLFAAASDAGHGGADWTTIAEVQRPDPTPSRGWPSEPA